MIVSRNPEVVMRELKDTEEALLLHRVTGAYHRLNRTGALIWHALERPLTLGELEGRVRLNMTEAPVSLRADLRIYLDELAGRDLVLLELGAGEG